MTSVGRRLTVLLLVYAAALAGWSWFSSAVAPGLILDAMAGDAGRALDRAVRWFARNRPAEVVIREWREAAPAVAGALALHAGLVVMIGVWSRRGSPVGSWTRAAASAFLAIASLAFLVASALEGAIQDYYLYLQIWGEVLAGRDPWFLVLGGGGYWYSLNAYGPLYNALAIPTLWNPLAPKLIFAAAYWAFASWLALDLAGRRGRPGWASLALAAWFATPYAWVEIARFGHFDVLVALLAIAAAEARARGRWKSGAAWLTAGVLLKYFPAVLAPFLALDRGRVRWRWLAATAGLSLAGLAVAGLAWGPSVVRPISLAVGRESAYLSIFYALRGPLSPIGRDTLFFSTDEYATPILLLALYRAWTWARRTRMDPLAAGVLAIATTLLFYKVGFPQYYMLLFLMAPYWYVRDFDRLRLRGPLAATYLACFGWIGWFDVKTAQETVGQIVPWAGVPTFLLMLGLTLCIAFGGPREDPEAVEASA